MSKYVYKIQLIVCLKLVTNFGMQTLFVFRGIVVLDYMGKISFPLFMQDTSKQQQQQNSNKNEINLW